MTKSEAIEKLDDLRDEVYNEDSDGHSYAQAIDMATESLRADTVSRSQYQGLLNAIGKVYVEVVRCKDCKWHECSGLPCPLDLCESLGDDGFCSRGERREP